MTSSESMDDSFRVRVEKVFGSLSSTKSSSSLQQSSPWSLTDDEVEKREWRRDKDTSGRDERPCSSSFDDFFKRDRKQRNETNLRDELEDDDLSNPSCRRGEENRDEWEVRSSIGLDCTLDYEEEEDEFDKVASGRENAGERLYMKDVTDQGSYLNFHNVLPDSVNGTTKDPRANHLAAKVRLKEDEGEAPKYNFRNGCDTEVEQPYVKASEDGGKLRSILKRKDNNEVSKSQKRVRFDPRCEEASENFQDVSVGTSSLSATVLDDGSRNASVVPDYLLNPSKYTRYNFDSSSEIDEKSNAQAFVDFHRLDKRSKPTESGSELEDALTDLPKSVTFIPKKKARDDKAINYSSEVKLTLEDDGKQSLQRAAFPVSIAAGEAQHYEVGAVEEIEPETNAADKSAGFQKLGRRYRTKSRLDDSDS